MATGLRLPVLWLPALLTTTTLLPVPARCVRPHDRRLELLRFALRRDREWRLVLEQPVKPVADLGLPSWLDRPPDVAVAPLPLIREAVDRYAWYGSRIECAIRVMGQAFACVVYEHLSHVTEIIDGLQTKTGADATHAYADAYRQAWFAAVMLADKMAAADGGTGRLTALADLSVESLRALAGGPPTAEFRLMRRRIDRFVDERCVRPDPMDVYKSLGFIEVDGNPFDEDATGESISDAVARVVEKLFVFYDGLRIETMPVDAWARVFDYHVPDVLALPIGASYDDENAGSGHGTGGSSTGTLDTECHCHVCVAAEGMHTSGASSEAATGNSTDVHGTGCQCYVCGTDEIVEGAMTDDSTGTHCTGCSCHACDTATVEDIGTWDIGNSNGTVTDDSTHSTHGTGCNCDACGNTTVEGTVAGDSRDTHGTGCTCHDCHTATVEGTDPIGNGNRTD